jgi:hypothetical protein
MANNEQRQYQEYDQVHILSTFSIDQVAVLLLNGVRWRKEVSRPLWLQEIVCKHRGYYYNERQDWVRFAHNLQ